MKHTTWKLTSIVLAGLLAGSIFTNVALAKRQVLMKDALRDLQTARGTLEAAEPDKGGHREEAIKLADKAIDEVKLGIEFANHH